MSGLLDIFDKDTVVEPFASLIDGAEVLDFFVDIKGMSVRVELKSHKFIPKPDLYEFSDRVEKTYGLSNLEIKIKYSNLEFNDEYYRHLLVSLFRKNSICKAFLVGSYAELTNDVLRVSNVKCGKEILEKNNCKGTLKELISYELDRSIEVEIDAQSLDMTDYEERKKERLEEIDRKAAVPVLKEIPKTDEPKGGDGALSVGTIYGMPLSEEVIPMLDVRSGMGFCAVRGEVLDVDVREINKDGKLMYIAVNFDIGDDTWGISCEIFGKAEQIKKAVPAIKIGNIL